MGELKPTRRILYVVNEDFAFLLNRLPMARAARDAGFEVHVARGRCFPFGLKASATAT